MILRFKDFLKVSLVLKEYSNCLERREIPSMVKGKFPLSFKIRFLVLIPSLTENLLDKIF